jgi:transposase
MAQLGKADLEQMTDAYLQSLGPERLVAVAKNLRALAVEQLEKLEESSKTSSRPPSSDSPYQSTPRTETETAAADEADSGDLAPLAEGSSEEAAVETKADEAEPSAPASSQGGQGFARRPAGKQPGAKGKWRDQPLRAERTIPHYPEQCSACHAPLGVEHRDEKPHGGYYQFELNHRTQGFSLECQLHHYYGSTCACGHHSQAKPGQGECSEVKGRKVQLQLQEQVLIGPMLATFIASLS